MRADTADRGATSHAGRYGGFGVSWYYPDDDLSRRNLQPGWYVWLDNVKNPHGPYATSQAAFGAVKDCIDKIIEEEG